MPQDYEWVESVVLTWQPNTRAEPGAGKDLVAFTKERIPVFPHQGHAELFKAGETWRCKVKRYQNYGFAMGLEIVSQSIGQPVVDRLVDPAVRAYVESLVERRIKEEREDLLETQQSLEQLRKSNPELFRGGIVEGVRQQPKASTSEQASHPDFLRVKFLHQLVANRYWGKHRIAERDLRRGLPKDLDMDAFHAVLQDLVKTGTLYRFKDRGDTQYSLNPAAKSAVFSELEIAGHAVESKEVPVADLIEEAEAESPMRALVEKEDLDRAVSQLRERIDALARQPSNGGEVDAITLGALRRSLADVEKRCNALDAKINRAAATSEKAEQRAEASMKRVNRLEDADNEKNPQEMREVIGFVKSFGHNASARGLETASHLFQLIPGDWEVSWEEAKAVAEILGTKVQGAGHSVGVFPGRCVVNTCKAVPSMLEVAFVVKDDVFSIATVPSCKDHYKKTIVVKNNGSKMKREHRADLIERILSGCKLMGKDIQDERYILIACSDPEEASYIGSHIANGLGIPIDKPKEGGALLVTILPELPESSRVLLGVPVEGQ